MEFLVYDKYVPSLNFENYQAEEGLDYKFKVENLSQLIKILGKKDLKVSCLTMFRAMEILGVNYAKKAWRFKTEEEELQKKWIEIFKEDIEEILEEKGDMRFQEANHESEP